MDTCQWLQILAFALLIGGAVTSTQAQSTTPLPDRNATEVTAKEAAAAALVPVQSAVGLNNIGTQTALALTSEFDGVAESALKNTYTLANRYGSRIDLGPAVLPLLDIFEDHEDDEVHIMALMALHAIGDEDGLQALRWQIREGELSHRIRAIALAILLDHYVP